MIDHFSLLLSHGLLLLAFVRLLRRPDLDDESAQVQPAARARATAAVSTPAPEPVAAPARARPGKG